MAVLTNTVLTSDVASALNIEFAKRFNGEVNDLARILGIVTPETMTAGTTLYQYTVTGSLNPASASRAEGDEVPLSKYGLTIANMDSLKPIPYRKLTTAEAVLKAGVTNAVLREDAKMLADIRNTIVTDFITGLNTGTGTADGTTLQDALAQSDAVIQDAMETNHDSYGRLIHIVNPFDIADYLGKANITTQTAFGMTYLESFVGIENVLVTNKVEKGNIIVTPSENLHLFNVDFASLAAAGLPYQTVESGFIGVSHEPSYERFGVITNAATGVKFYAEVLDYIVKATITPAP